MNLEWDVTLYCAEESPGVNEGTWRATFPHILLGAWMLRDVPQPKALGSL